MSVLVKIGLCSFTIQSNTNLKNYRTMITDVNQINTETEDGKMLMAALAKITTESQTDKTPYEVLEQLNDLKDKMEF